MSNLTIQDAWDATVNKIDDQEYITESLLNAAPQSLANRTLYLKNHRHDGVRTPNYFATATVLGANSLALALDPECGNVLWMPIHFQSPILNTGAVVLRVGSSDETTLIQADGTWLEMGQLRIGGVYTIMYVGGDRYMLLNPSAPVGLLRWHISPNGINGYLGMDGTLVSRSGAYAALWAWAQAQGIVVPDATWSAGYRGLFSSGNGSTTFRLPKVQGEFPRFYDAGAGVDPGRAFGLAQLDAIQNITGKFGIDNITQTATTPEGAFYYDPPDVHEANTGPGGVAEGAYANFDASRIVRTAAETRSRNITFTLHIKY
jgi:hypothetical protein